MGDELLPYLNKELAFLHNLADDKFRKGNPQVATRLGLGPSTIRDPHVRRLIEGVAYLNARVRCKLDDDFPELTHALLDVLCPHYLAPMPSLAIAQFLRDRKGSTPAGYTLKRHTYLETSPEPQTNESCVYRTCYDVQLWPIEIETAGVSGQPLPAPEVEGRDRSDGVVRIALKSVDPDWTFPQLRNATLRFYIQRPEQYVYGLYELLLNDPTQVAIAKSPTDPAALVLGPQALHAVGFGADQTLLPYDDRVFAGYRYLTEFFAFPQKFLFFELELNERVLRSFGNRLEIYIYTRTLNRHLEATVNKDTFALGCTPIVNLFPIVTDPISITHERYEYRVVPDRRRQHLEVYSVDRVFSKDDQGRVQYYLPFYGIHHSGVQARDERFWHATRRSDPYQSGTETTLVFVNPDFNTEAAPAEVFTVEATCCNRDLPARLPFGGGQPGLTLRDGGAPVVIQCVTPPTETLRPALREGSWWRLISHLSLNHLSITGGKEGADALKEILRLYDFRGSEESRTIIEGIVSVDSGLTPGRIRVGARSAICQGVSIALQLDETRYPSSNQFLFTSVLERFLNLYCSINCFTQLTVKQKRGDKVLYKWPARTGPLPIL